MSKIKLSLLTVAFLSSLHAQDITLDKITVVSATKSEQSLKHLTSNVSIIDSDEIEMKHYTSVLHALNSIAGINYTSNGGLGSTSNINLRGASNNRVLVLVDGVRYQDPSSTSGASIGHLMIDDVARIEVIKGAQSGIWGADASAGVINIITKKASKGTKISVNVEAGSFATKKIGAILSHKASKFDVKLSASKIKSDSFSVQAPRDENVNKFEDDKYSNLTLNLQANYNITDDAKLGFNITSIDALKDYDSFGNPDDTTMKSDISNRLYSLSYTQDYSNHHISLKAQKSEFSRDEIGTVAAWGSEYVKVFNGEHINLELIDNIKYNNKDFVLIGLGISSDEVEYIMTDDAKTEQKNKDNYIYITNSNHFGDLIFTQSLRYDDYDNFDSKATGKIGIKYNINDDMFVSSNIGLGYNVPNIVQELNPWGAVNTDLNPEDTKSSDISFGFKGFKATYFYNRVKDLIEWYDPDGWGGNPAIYKNLDGKTTFKGIELAYKQQITDSFLITLNYSKISAKDKDSKKLARRAEDSALVGFDYYPTDNLHIGMSGKHVGKRYNKSDEQGVQTGKYTIVDAVANYDINDNTSLYFKVDNLTDKYYQTIDGYATASRSGYVGIKVTY